MTRDETKKLYINAINHTDGRQCSVAKYLNTTDRNVWAYYKRNPEVKMKAEQRREIMLEQAEQHLARIIEDGDNFNAIKFVLTTLGRDIYSTRTEQSVSIEQAPNISIQLSNEDTDAKKQYNDIDGLLKAIE